MRPSLIWDWTKLDVLPLIGIFDLACALGVPFIDKTVRVITQPPPPPATPPPLPLLPPHHPPNP